jgi:hypothetical protein
MNEGYVTAAQYDAVMGEARMPGDFYEFAKLMIDDPRVNKDIKDKWWGFLNKETKLCRMETKDRWAASNDFAIQRMFKAMSQPAYSVDINELSTLSNTRRRFMTQVNRGIGGFERQALMTQIKEFKTGAGADAINSGFWSGLKKKIGLGKEEEHASS